VENIVLTTIAAAFFELPADIAGLSGRTHTGTFVGFGAGDTKL
jgi:hypothetical protein